MKGEQFNVNGLVIDGADTGRPTLRALYETDPEWEVGREATVAELAFWREIQRLRAVAPESHSDD